MLSDHWTFAAISAVVALSYAWIRHRRGRRSAEALAEAEAQGARQPPSLHPVINPNLCIGSASCVSACPEGDVLGLVDGSGALIRGAACVGHGRCALECPVDAIRLVIGSEQRGIDLPEVSSVFESSRPGVFVIGELGGMGLIKNAMRQGLQAGAHLVEELGEAARGDPAPAVVNGQSRVDVVVVGAGPAGVACASQLVRAGLEVAVFERDAFGGTIANFPRHKVVMSEALEIPGYGRFGASTLTKTELMTQLADLRRAFGLPIYEGVELTKVWGERGNFEITTTKGHLHAERVVLAIGRRGNPRKLGVPGEDLPHVTYALTDPEQYVGHRVLVVGGGDSAVEAAVDLASTPGCTAAIAYRKPSFNRCRAKNREKLDKTLAAGTLEALTETEPVRIEEGQVVLRTPQGEVTRDFDRVIICAGGTPPTDFLEAAGVGLERHQGKEALANPSAPIVKDDKGGTRSVTDDDERRQTRRFEMLLFALGVAIVAALAFFGAPYYLTAEEARVDHSMHQLWRPAGHVGHGIGVVATLVMMSNFIYPVRKRWKRMKGLSSINRWLSFHVFVGLMSPAVIAFHAAFQSNNMVATITFLSLVVVVGTGLVGRYAYGLLAARSAAHDASAARIRRFMHGWRIFHVSLAVVLMVVMGAHIGVALYLGFGWIS